MLKVRYTQLSREPFWITERNFSIGSSDDNHLKLEGPAIAAHHARVVRDKETILVRDLGSETGTYVNGYRVSTRPISCGDRVLIGDIELEVVDPISDALAEGNEYWSLIGISSWLAGQEFPLIFDQDTPLLLGRGKQCNIVFPGTHLSREHARITRLSNKELLIEDLKSANAIFVNDEKVDQARLRAGDEVRLDVYNFRLFGPGIQLHKSATRPFHMLAKEAKSAEKPALVKPQKRWKVRATSPGNREEPAAPAATWRHWLAASLLLAVLLGVIVQVLLSFTPVGN